MDPSNKVFVPQAIARDVNVVQIARSVGRGFVRTLAVIPGEKTDQDAIRGYLITEEVERASGSGTRSYWIEAFDDAVEFFREPIPD